MANGFTNFVKKFAAKSSAQMAVQLRKNTAAKTEREVNNLATEIYNREYLGDIYRAPIVDVVAQLQSYIQYQMYGWRTLPNNVSSDGTYVELNFINEFRETFHLGIWGCPLEPLTMAGRMRKNMMEYQNEQEAVSVPYQIWCRIKVRQYSGFVSVDTSLEEQIDPHNEVPYLRNGHFRAPSMKDVRVSISQDSLRGYLHQHCQEDIPSLQAWFVLPETQARVDIAAAVGKVHAAQAELERVSAELKQLG